MSSTDSTKYNSEDIIKREARVLGGGHLGEIKDISHDYVITEKGVIEKDRFHIPRNSIIHLDGQYVWFGMTEDEVKQYKKD